MNMNFHQSIQMRLGYWPCRYQKLL